MDNRQDIRDQFYSYLQGTADAEIMEGLFTYFATELGKVHLSELVDEAFDDGIASDPVLLAKVLPLTERVGRKLAEQISPAKQLTLWKRSYTLVAIAASILLAIASYLYLRQVSIAREMRKSIIAIDALPGTNRATLKLSDGRTIDLSKAINGKLSLEQGMQISKTADGQIEYHGSSKNNAVLTNTVATPNGGQYRVRLPDGTEVWLNAASSITYATNMSISKDRVVHLSGEAYFEVAHDTSRPFFVKTKDEQVRVLGTHFNISSYGNEDHTTTTLTEGSVKVTRHQQNVTLKPGQQAIGNRTSLQVEPADVELALAWKNGNLVFKSATLEQIMRQVERWYDVEVVYEGKVRHRVFSGGIPRSNKLSVLLNILTDSGVEFELKQTPQGKTLVIHD